jgi:hypothetical protein
MWACIQLPTQRDRSMSTKHNMDTCSFRRWRYKILHWLMLSTGSLLHFEMPLISIKTALYFWNVKINISECNKILYFELWALLITKRRCLEIVLWQCSPALDAGYGLIQQMTTWHQNMAGSGSCCLTSWSRSCRRSVLSTGVAESSAGSIDFGISLLARSS